MQTLFSVTNVKKTSKPGGTTPVPIIITSYEIVIRDKAFLSKFHWKFLIIDEGHRLKNLNCKLIQELKKLSRSVRCWLACLTCLTCSICLTCLTCLMFRV